MSTHQYDFTEFSQVEAEGAFTLDITRADTYSVSIESNDPGYVRIEKLGSTLKVGRRGWLGFLSGHSHARITMPALERVTLSGASHGKVAGFQSDGELSIRLSGASHLEVHDTVCGRLRLDVSGASNLVGDVTTRETEMGISGASRVELSGSGGKAHLRLSGASQARLPSLSLTDTGLESSGASSSQLKVNGKLDLALGGASRLEYGGTAVLGDVRVSGASTLNRRP
jgi:hypothetical protein